MGQPRQFTTLPVRAIADARLTALELRCLGVIALHDGMSTVKGSGPGCYAKSMTLAALARTDITRFSRSVSRLIKLGYLLKEAQEQDRRRFTLRIIYGDDNSWRVGQLSPEGETGEIVDELVNESPEMVDEAANYQAEIVDRDDSGNGSFPPVSGPHYISLNEELDFVETKELNSVETAQREDFTQRGGEGKTSGNVVCITAARDRSGCPGDEVDEAQRLKPSWPKLPAVSIDGALIQFERAFAAIGRNPYHMEAGERERYRKWLYAMNDCYAGTPTGHHALRLHDEIWSWDVIPSDLSTDDLRDWLKAALDKLGYGGQARMAKDADMPAPTLHGFRYGKSLPDRFRPGLQAACHRALSYGEWRSAA